MKPNLTYLSLALAAFTSLAHAHFVFVVPQPGGASASVFISETLQPDAQVDANLVSGAKLTLRASNGRESPLTLAKSGNAYSAPVTGSGVRTIHGLADLGVRKVFHQVNLKPGKPIWFGVKDHQDGKRTLVFGLPGNPVSTMVTFLLFAAPMLRALAGELAAGPRFAQARLAHPEAAATGITRFLPAELTADWTEAKVCRIPWQGSGDLAATALSNCFVILPPDTALDTGASVQILLP